MKVAPFKILGIALCPFCGKPAVVKTSKKGWVYFNCGTHGGGDGCGVQVLARGEGASRNVMAKVIEWHADAKEIVEPADGLQNWRPPAPANDNPPLPKPANRNDPAPKRKAAGERQTTTPRKSIWDREF
ncbi:MAG TPA: hypothetical protein VMU87_01395 [Stellaceae bacterium]|nr:hypothetical protein [Stellaceae bacterium]